MATIAEWNSLRPDSHTSNVVVGIKATISRSQLDKKIWYLVCIKCGKKTQIREEKNYCPDPSVFLRLKPMVALPFKDGTMWHIHLIIFTSKCEIEQLRVWCQYWILVAVLTVFERVGDTFVSWLPMYCEAKLAFFGYLWYPKAKLFYEFRGV
ncbi:hypothetical protein MRB53_021373 [Persea americana]|uniref:Uncharacterized protein n=1 Tax=Persea americana TaxID=3435 RepID=A0ACC2L3U0_PERAE|nr:hypothetical protein MRB53_021373 [Persea americana]